MRIHLTRINCGAPTDPAELEGDLDELIAPGRPVAITLDTGKTHLTSAVTAFGPGWVSTKSSTYAVRVLPESLRGFRRKESKQEVELTWSNSNLLIAALYLAQNSSATLDNGALRSAFGITEEISFPLRSALQPLEEHLRQACCLTTLQAVAATRGLVSSLALSWFQTLRSLDWGEELLIGRHETRIKVGDEEKTFAFLSVWHKQRVTYCALSEIPAIDYELGDNLRRLRAAAEGWL